MRTTTKGSKPGLHTCFYTTTEPNLSAAGTPLSRGHTTVKGEKTTEACGRQSSLTRDTSQGRDDAPNEEETYYPEGGVQAWLVTFGSFCAMFGAFGLLNSIGTLQAYLAENQLKHYSQSSISWIFSIYFFLVFFCGIQIGPIFDSRGPRLLLIGGTVLEILSLMFLGFCTGAWIDPQLHLTDANIHQNIGTSF